MEGVERGRPMAWNYFNFCGAPQKQIKGPIQIKGPKDSGKRHSRSPKKSCDYCCGQVLVMMKRFDDDTFILHNVRNN